MGAKTNSFYNNISWLYPLIDVFLKPQKRLLFNEVGALPTGRLLEIGVGDGSHFQLYKKHEVTGIDTSASMLEKARGRSGNKIRLFEMDGTALKFDDCEFDYAILSHVIAVVDDPEKLLAEVHRVLKPQGQIIILNHFTPDNWLKYVDGTFALISKRLHFKSVFRIDDIAAIKKFDIIKAANLGFASYFKLLIYQKP